jgi:transposase
VSTQGAWSNYTNLSVEPADHAIGRSRGGLSTKIHQLVDGAGLPLVLLTPGHAGDSPMFEPLMDHLRTDRPIGRPKTRPDAVLGDKAYSSRAIRAHLRRRRITTVLAEPDDQKHTGTDADTPAASPPAFDTDRY